MNPLFLLSLGIPLVLLIPHNVFAWHAITAACNNMWELPKHYTIV